MDVCQPFPIFLMTTADLNDMGCQRCQQVTKGLTRLPADTPRTPGPRSVDFQQFSDRLRTDLPDDSPGRGSFDTSARLLQGTRVPDSVLLHLRV